MIGDFNEITNHHEKRRRRRRPENFIDFRLMRQSCGMVDFVCIENSLSWVGRRGSNVIRCRLDRLMGNENWYKLFSHTEMEYFRFIGSDHRPLLTYIKTRKMLGTKKFWFDKR